MKILVTGCAGFIGMHVAERLLARGDEVVGVDNINEYYDIKLKYARLKNLEKYQNFKFNKIDIANYEGLKSIFETEKPEKVVNLAAQAGVRYSIKNPHVYLQSNLVGFGNILELCRNQRVKHLVYASSSSVYGANSKIPFSVTDRVDAPVSLYAATKKANELMAHTYSHLYALPTTGLRYFTVYGPWGRPDMAPWLFTSAICEGKPIDIFNHGEMERDFTFIDDIVDGTVKIIDSTARECVDLINENEAIKNEGIYKIYNIGNNKPVKLMKFIEILEGFIEKKSIKNFLPMQPGDVYKTYADIDDISRDVGYAPVIDLEVGLGKWWNWYREYASRP